MAAAPLPPVNITPEAPQSARLSQGERIVNTFIAPSKTFSDLRRSASWWAPFLIIVAFSYMFMYVMSRQVGFEQISKNEIARSPRRADQFEKAPPDQQARTRGG